MIKIGFLLMGLILLAACCSAESFPVLTYTNGLCTDSDGFDPYLSGNVSMLYKDQAYLFFDSCADAGALREWFCYADRPESSIYPCPPGYGCGEGACFSNNSVSALVPESFSCVDSEGLCVEGGGYAATFRGGKELYVLNDSCIDWFTLSDAYCKNAGNQSYGAYEDVNCPDGLVCVGGACVILMPAVPERTFAVSNPPVLQVRRTLPNLESVGDNVSVRLDVVVDVSHSPCAFGLSERVPGGWSITNVSSGGVIGAYPGNGSIRLSNVVSALNAWCNGSGLLDDAVNVIWQWRRDGISDGVIEWVFWNTPGQLKDLGAGYTVSVPYNASVNSYFYGDSTLDGEKYKETSGNYMAIVQRMVTTTTAVTTTSFPVSRVSGIVYREENWVPVPGALVSINCSEKYGGYAKDYADEHGYYTAEIPCPFGSRVSVAASSPQGVVCIAPDDCVMYPEEKGGGYGVILSPGYARFDVPLFAAS